MARYIDADALLKNAQTYSLEFGEYIGEDVREVDAVLVSRINSTPTADVAPVVRGKWIKTTLDSGWVECVCSICGGDAPAEYGRYTWLKTDFCPSCGSAMLKDESV